MGHAININTTCGDVGGNQCPDLAVTETVQRPLAGVLGLVAVDCIGLDTGILQVSGNPVSAMLGAGEDQHAIDAFIFDQLVQQCPLVVFRDIENLLLDPCGGGCFTGNFGTQGIFQQAVSQSLNRFRHGSREQDSLMTTGDCRSDFLNVTDEAHVEHAVGFIKDENFNAAETNMALTDQIHQTTRRSDQNMDALCQCLDLRANGNTAEYNGRTQAKMTAVRADAVANLAGQLAGWCKNDCLRLITVGALVEVGQAVQQGQGEGRCLAGTGLGNAQQVTAIEQAGNGFRLNGGRVGVAFSIEGTENGFGQIKA